MLEFWYEFGSTYSYPAAVRIEGLAAAAGVEVVWRPFLLGPLFKRQGWNDSPYNVNPARGQYMWHDVARTCARHGIPFRKPSVFPRRALLPARIGMLDEMQPHLPAFSRAVYRANFVEDREIDDPATIASIVAGLGGGAAGLDAHRLIARAGEAAVKERLRQRTEEAWERGIVGAPSCIVEGEVFWGQDRLEEAMAWAAHGEAASHGGATAAGGATTSAVGGPASAGGGTPSARANALIVRLGLEPHPEGGHYREIHRSSDANRVNPGDDRGARAGLTVIHFLLRAGEVSRWHRVRADEAWQVIEGDGLELLVAAPDVSAIESIRLGPTASGGLPVHVVPAGAWQAARPIGSFALAACDVGPGFDFADFQLMSEVSAAVATMRSRWPGHAGLI